ncbi:MAG: carbohydrate ABC transporter permease [Clostridia bacterium]|nr:carbohydrate ABC transporter permease [Clostridia bacterium]
MINNKKNRMMQILWNVIIILLCISIIIPCLLIISISLSNENDIVLNGYKLVPEHFDLSAYKYIFKNPGTLIDAYKITTLYSVIGTFLSVFLMAMISYALSRKFLPGRNKISFYLYFTTMFSGGLVPAYILNTQFLHINDTILIYILPSLIVPWFIFMLRTFFADIPEALAESAYIDGANEFTIFIKIMAPMAKPALAFCAFTSFLSFWNNWMTSMLYINNQKLISLQYLLQRIILDSQILQSESAMSSGLVDIKSIPTETVRMGMAIIVAGPALVIFPFFQKYFVKGIAVGSVKG